MKYLIAYGAGVYFARDASYSHSYTNLGGVGLSNANGNKSQAHLFVCKVLVGYHAVGSSQMETKNLPKISDGITSGIYIFLISFHFCL